MTNRTQDTQFFKKNQNLLYVLTIYLFYPAVLGSIIYSIFGNLHAANDAKWSEIHFCSILMMAGVVVFFSIDYVYTTLHSSYGWIAFAADIVLLVAMQGAFGAVNFLARQPDPVLYSRYMAITFAIFVVWDIARRKGIGHMFRYIIVFEIGLLAIFTFMASRDVGFLLPGMVSVVTATGMIAFFLSFYFSPPRPPYSVQTSDPVPPQPAGPGLAERTEDLQIATNVNTGLGME